MSPLQAMERSYSALKSRLHSGTLPPGHRLEAARLADEFGVSMTPVRDALNRLVGEQMVAANAGEGFHVPRFSEAELRNLYEWHSALAVMAVRTARALPDRDDVQRALAGQSPAMAVSLGFELLAEAATNRDLRHAILNAGDRLHAFRQFEHRIIPYSEEELEAMLLPGADQRGAIRRYHLTRMRAVPDLLEAMTARK